MCELRNVAHNSRPSRAEKHPHAGFSQPARPAFRPRPSRCLLATSFSRDDAKRAHDALCSRQNNPQRQRGSEHESQIKLKVCGAHSLAHAAGYLAPAGTAVDRRGAHSLADAAGYIPQSQSAPVPTCCCSVHRRASRFEQACNSHALHGVVQILLEPAARESPRPADRQVISRSRCEAHGSASSVADTDPLSRPITDGQFHEPFS